MNQDIQLRDKVNDKINRDALKDVTLDKIIPRLYLRLPDLNPLRLSIKKKIMDDGCKTLQRQTHFW